MEVDYTKAIAIAQNVYWVGVYMKDDIFQCHAYLIVDGDESILIDPGSMLEFEAIKEKVASIIDLQDIKYIIAHHQDPDVCANIPAFEKVINRNDLELVSHSRNFALIKHYGISSKYYVIEEHDYRLKTEHFDFSFLTTPYAHAPGAFVTCLENEKILFSSDIFGGVEESWHFYADENYFDEIKEFHENYMPSQDILSYSLEKIEVLDLELIAPQHGCIIQKKYIQKIINELKELKCGLYIDAGYEKSLIESKKREQKQNEKLNTVLDSLENIIVISTDGRELKYINKSFFRFSKFKDFEEFRKKHKCICELFVDYKGENYLKPHYENTDNWITVMMHNPNKEFFAIMKNSEGVETIFKTTLKQIEENEFLVSFNDITIYQENMQFIDFLSKINVAYFIVTNMDGSVESISSSLLNVLHVDDFRPKKYKNSDFLNKKDFQAAMQHIQNNDSSPYEVVIRHKNITIPVLVQGYFGVITHKPVRVAVAIDLREIKKLQNEAKQHDLLLVQQSKLAQMGEMVSMIAHQWRQPLNAISAASIQSSMKYELELLSKEDFSKAQEFVQEECQKMSKVIDTFMNYAKDSASEETFYFGDVYNIIMELIGARIIATGITIEKNIDSKFEIFGNRNMLEQILLNILVNSIDAFKEQQTLSNKILIINTTVDNKIEIIDNAGGISDQNIEKLFMPYFTTKKPGKGTGLGLYMSKKIMQEHFHGNLLYEKAKDGSKFILNFDKLIGGGITK